MRCKKENILLPSNRQKYLNLKLLSEYQSGNLRGDLFKRVGTGVVGYCSDPY